RWIHALERAPLCPPAAAVPDVRDLSRGRSHRHAVCDGAIGRKLRIHGHARVGCIAPAGHLGADACRHSARRCNVSRRRVRSTPGGAPRAADSGAVERRIPHRGATVPVGILVQAGSDVRQHPQRPRRHDADWRSHLRIRRRAALTDRPYRRDRRLQRRRPLAARQSAHDSPGRRFRDARRRRRVGLGYRAEAVAADCLPGRSGAARAQHALRQYSRAEKPEDVALRDRLLEQGVLSRGGGRDDDSRTPLRVFSAPLRRRGLPDFCRDDARPRVLSDRALVHQPRCPERLATAFFGNLSAALFCRRRKLAALVARAALRWGRRLPRMQKLLNNLAAFAMMAAVPLAIAADAPATPATDAPTLKLPQGARPTRYALHLRVVLGEARVRGEIAIDIELEQARAVLWLNADSLTVTQATTERPETRATLLTGQEQFVGIAFEPALTAGRHRVIPQFAAAQI